MATTRMERHAVDARLMRDDVEFQPAAADLGVGVAEAAAHDGSDTGEDLIDAAHLGQHVVGPHIQGIDLHAWIY